MNRNHKVLISFGIVAVVAFFGFQINKTEIANKQTKKIMVENLSPETKEQNYRNAILSLVLKDDKLSEDEKIFKSLGDYLSSPYFLQYVNALEELKKPQPNYSLALDYLNRIPENYEVESSTAFNMPQTVEFLKNDIEYKKRKFDLQNSITSKGYIIKALSQYNGIKLNAIEWSTIDLLKKNNIEYKYLYDNMTHLITFPDKVVVDFVTDYGETFIFQIQDNNGNVIDPYEILTDYAVGISIKEKNLQEERSQKVNEENKKQHTVSIGMTSNEVEKAWGKPDHVNRTTTANGVSEQWVYGSNRYVYLDDGVVTAIQD